MKKTFENQPLRTLKISKDSHGCTFDYLATMWETLASTPSRVQTRPNETKELDNQKQIHSSFTEHLYNYGLQAPMGVWMKFCGGEPAWYLMCISHIYQYLF